MSPGTGPQTDPDGAIAAYLDAVTGALPAGRRTRAAIRAELADGLWCDVEARVECGADPLAAAAEAIAESGPPAVVARAFARELLAESAHRIGLGLLLAGPLIGLLWVASTPAAPGESWPARVGAALSAAPMYPYLLILLIPAALIACAAAGPLGPRLDRFSAPAARFAVWGCMLGDAHLLATGLLTHAAGWPLLFAATASAARLTVTAAAAHRFGRLRAAAA
ncbi:hypothetical protein [Dactylosporangium darangshiense]|uniref:Integral membrane protein n=1 Tax=Dactylosporangium darangshiense TaxID=579108 RepID=A0ABP8DRU7_9ACTN